MSDKLERFTKRARRVLTLAQEQALRLNHNHIGTEHLLLGLVQEENSVAVKVLKSWASSRARSYAPWSAPSAAENAPHLANRPLPRAQKELSNWLSKKLA